MRIAVLASIAVMGIFIHLDAFSAEEKKATADLLSKSPSRSLFVVETDSDSAYQSLNRISGEIDPGFTTPDQTYDSSSHYHPSPFALSKASDSRDSSGTNY